MKYLSKKVIIYGTTFFNKTTRVKYVRPYSNNAMVKAEAIAENNEEIMIDNKK